MTLETMIIFAMILVGVIVLAVSWMVNEFKKMFK